MHGSSPINSPVQPIKISQVLSAAVTPLPLFHKFHCIHSYTLQLAMAGKCRAIHTATMAVVVVAVLMAAAVTGVVAKDSSGTPSSLTTWRGADCSGDTSTIGACGCTDLVNYAGQEFHYRGETATLYTGTGCVGTPYQVFEFTQACGDFGWRSINIDC